jgi:hypothetical protein
MKYLVLALACALAAPVALAQSGYVEIERRLSAEQLREVGLTPAQLATLNRLLRNAETRQAAQAPARKAFGAMLDILGVVISQSSSSLSTPTIATSSGTLIS